MTRKPTGSASETYASDRWRSFGHRVNELVLTRRAVLLCVLIFVTLVVMSILDATGALTAPYNSDYLAATLISVVPLAMLGVAELLVILSGRGGIDLSIGAAVSLTGMLFGISYGQWGWSFVAALLFAIAAGAVAGGVNGLLVAGAGFPPLIATLATAYVFQSAALVVSDSRPINAPRIQALYVATSAIELPVIGGSLPLIPVGVFTFLLPTAVVIWILLTRTVFGRKVYAIGTNDTAARWTGIDVRITRAGAYVLSGVIAALVSVYTVAQFASARPDAGTAGNGLALPAITIAVLGGVAITGGIGRVGGVLLAALLITWLNAGLLLALPGNDGVQVQLFALGAILIGAALLNGRTQRSYGPLHTTVWQAAFFDRRRSGSKR